MEKLFWLAAFIFLTLILVRLYDLFKNAKARKAASNQQSDVNCQQKEKSESETVQNEEIAEVSEPVADVKSEKKELPPTVETRDDANDRLWQNELWQRWRMQTGNWNMDIRLVVAVAGTLELRELEYLLSVYREEHPNLYSGVLFDPQWLARCANPPAEFLGKRIEVLKNAYGALIPADEKQLWNWWVKKAGKTRKATDLQQTMVFMSQARLNTLKKQLELHISSAEVNDAQEKELADVYCAQLAAVKAFLK